MNWKNTLKKAGLVASIAAIGSVGLATQAQASIYARSYLDIDGLTISSDPLANSPIAGTFNFSLTNTAFLNGSLGSIGGDTCFGTTASNNCGSETTLDAVQASENSPVGENVFTPFNGPGGLEYSRADSIINSAQLADGTASDTQNIAESELQTGFSANANSEILSTTGLEFVFNVADQTLLSIAFTALVDMLAEINDLTAANAAAQSTVTTLFRLSNDLTGEFLEWNPTDLAASCGDVRVVGTDLGCTSTSASADLNSTN